MTTFRSYRVAVTLFALGWLCSLGCGSNGPPKTGIIVEVVSDLRITDEIDQVQLTAKDPQQNQVYGHLFDLGEGANRFSFPLRAGLYPLHDSLTPIHIEAVGLFKGNPVVTRSATLSFSPGRKVVLVMPLWAVCMKANCTVALTTCKASGSCEDDAVASTNLPTYVANAPVSTTDAFNESPDARRSGPDAAVLVDVVADTISADAFDVPVGTGGADAREAPSGTGGAPGADAPSRTGGVSATGGTPATGGIPATGGAPATGGIPATGGAPATGGIPATGGTTVPNLKALGQPCAVGTECLSGTCANRVCDASGPPSCASLDKTCGPLGTDSCCTSLPVQGGTYLRSYSELTTLNDNHYPATVSDFYLDKYEVTVGRFRAFVNAGMGTQAKPPEPGAGKHPTIEASGWDKAWNALLPVDTAALKFAINWTDLPGSNESRPMNGINWYMSLAFCAWDRGRLPTEAEWNYAAAGGSEQRVYAWSNPPNSTAIDPSNAVYATTSPANVGLKSPKGDGKWGHSDLTGNVQEWTLDTYGVPYPSPCNDCASLKVGSPRVVRGGDYSLKVVGWNLMAGNRYLNAPEILDEHTGVRCARTGP